MPCLHQGGKGSQGVFSVTGHHTDAGGVSPPLQRTHSAPPPLRHCIGCELDEDAMCVCLAHNTPKTHDNNSDHAQLDAPTAVTPTTGVGAIVTQPVDCQPNTVCPSPCSAISSSPVVESRGPRSPLHRLTTEGTQAARQATPLSTPMNEPNTQSLPNTVCQAPCSAISCSPVVESVLRSPTHSHTREDHTDVEAIQAPSRDDMNVLTTCDEELVFVAVDEFEFKDCVAGECNDGTELEFHVCEEEIGPFMETVPHHVRWVHGVRGDPVASLQPGPQVHESIKHVCVDGRLVYEAVMEVDDVDTQHGICSLQPQHQHPYGHTKMPTPDAQDIHSFRPLKAIHIDVELLGTDGKSKSWRALVDTGASISVMGAAVAEKFVSQGVASWTNEPAPRLRVASGDIIRGKGYVSALVAMNSSSGVTDRARVRFAVLPGAHGAILGMDWMTRVGAWIHTDTGTVSTRRSRALQETTVVCNRRTRRWDHAEQTPAYDVYELQVVDSDVADMWDVDECTDETPEEFYMRENTLCSSV